LIRPDCLATVREEINRMMDGSTREYLIDGFLYERSECFRTFVFESGIGAAAGVLMKADTVRIMTDDLFAKQPGTGERLDWHNDMPYYPLKTGRVCSIWIAVEAISREMGSLELVPGSHAWNKWFLPQIPESVKDFPMAQDIDLEPCRTSRP